MNENEKLIIAFEKLDKENATEKVVEAYANALLNALKESKAIVLPPGNEELEEAIKDSVIESLIKENPNLKHLKPKRKKKNYRTKAKAETKAVENLVTEYPNKLIIPTLKGYENATSLTPNGNAYLNPLPGLEGLRFDDGKMYIEGMREAIGEAELQDLRTKENIEAIDLPLLRTFYSIILNEYSKNKKIGVVSIYIPTFASYIGRKNLTEARILDLIEQIKKFHNVVGIVKGNYGNSIYPVLNFEGYNKETNRINFYSPYMTHVIETIYANAIRSKKNKAKEVKQATQNLLPNHSYLILPSLVKKRNKRACENVSIIVTGIEQAGGTEYHISAETLVERNLQLKESITKHIKPGLLLKRCFANTWKYLKEDTTLLQTYKNVKLNGVPFENIDINDPGIIPTPATLNKCIFNITHEGKQKEK